VTAPPAGFADVHSHLLWGIDDGPPDRAGSLAMLEAYGRRGFTMVAATPHHDHPMFAPPARAVVVERSNELERLGGAGTPSIVPGGEIMFTDGFFDRIAAGALPTLGASRTYRVEFPTRPGGIPMGLDQAVFRLQLKEVALVIAHCERHRDLTGDGDLVDRLRRSGAFVQVNLLSIAGKYGREQLDTAWRLLEADKVDLLATDLHSADDAHLAGEALEDLQGWNAERLARLASTNPRAILQGAPWSIDRDA